MSKVQHTARLHERSVQKVANGTIKKGRKASTPRSRSVTTVTVDPRVWRKAKQLAKNDLSRIKVISPTEVIVK